MWTRPQIKDFKQKMHDDPDSMITVGRGEVVTVRVPTNEDGNYMFWEFATDHYDIGFGLSFEWTDSPVTSNSVGATPADEEDAGKGELGYLHCLCNRMHCHLWFFMCYCICLSDHLL